MSFNQTFSRLSMLGLPPSSSREILVTVQKWLQSCGPEWTVKRLKEIKLMYINFIAKREFKPSCWIACTPDGIPKGVFRNLFMCKPSRRVFYTLLMYTSLVSKKVTEEQKRKFFESVSSPPIDLPHIPFLKEVAREISKFVPNRKVMTYRDYVFSPTRFAPNFHCKSVKEDISILWEDIRSSIVWDFLDDPVCGPVVQDCLGDLYIRVTQSCDIESSNFVGKISVIQEPGFKARWIANPKRIFQIALLPLGTQLFSTLKSLSWDCTYDQRSGVNWLREKLTKQVLVHSVDLSDATNNFPLSLQTRFLRWISGLNEEDIRLFELVSQGSWFIPKSLLPVSSTYPNVDHEGSVRWTKGQPLGLYPSFPAFALCHGALVRAIEKSLNLSDTFRVLGDDIVISDSNVYEMYRKYLSLLHVPISESKTMVSDLVGEFAGTLVFKDKIFESHKWRTINLENCLSVIGSLPRKLDLNNQKEYLSFLLRTLPSPLGLNENPEGIRLRDRAAMTLPILMDIQEPTQTIERHTHDYLFRSSPGYQELWKKDTPCSLETILNLVDTSIQDPEFRVKHEFSGLEIYKRISRNLNFHTEVIPLEGKFTWNDIDFLTAHYTVRSSQSVQRKRSFFNLFLRKMEKNQKKLVQCSEATVKHLIERAMYAILTEELVDLYGITDSPKVSGKVEPFDERY